MKIILTGIGLLLVAAVGYYVFMQPAPAPTETPNDTNSQAKLDINVVCEGALAYMTFENGAAAEAFVQECKNGEHPEVIEQYKSQVGLGSGAAI